MLLAISPHLRDLVELDTLNVLDERPLTAAALTTLAETQWPAMRRLRFDGGGNARTKRAMARRWSAVASDFERVWAIRDDAPAGRVEPRPFDAQARYAPGELVQHPTEGRVVVCDLSEGATRFVGLDGWVIADRPVEGAVPYSPRERYAPNQRVEHPKFGVGVVVLDRGDRVDIDFGVRGGVRTLVHGR